MSQNGYHHEDRLIRIRVVGVGGGGCAAVNRMIEESYEGVDFVAVDSDYVTLRHSKAKLRVRLGDSLVKGLGAGGKPELGRQIAHASQDELYEVLRLSDLVFVLTTLGGGTGTGAAPVVARVAKQTGALVIAVATSPFSFEGRRRAHLADAGQPALQSEADVLIALPGDKIALASPTRLSLHQGYARLSEMLSAAACGITDLVGRPAMLNIDVADLKAMLRKGREIAFGIGFADGENAPVRAAEVAIHSPLLTQPIGAAQGILFNVTGGPGMSLSQVNDIAAHIHKSAHPDANLIFGVKLDENIGQGICVILYANNFA